MKESVVRIPQNKSIDYDFIAFSFNGKHSYEDFGIIRTSEGNRYNIELAPVMSDLTEKDVKVGTKYSGTTHEKKVFNISFAFESLTESKIQELKKWLNGKEIADLWFAEEPYKVYSAKVTSLPSIKTIPFDLINNGQSQRVYKGDGMVQFTCYYPYAHTPDYVEKYQDEKIIRAGDGKNLDSYLDFSNVEQWSEASGLVSSKKLCHGENKGALPTYFSAEFDLKEQELLGELALKIGNCDILINKENKSPYYAIKWDSKSGLILAKTSLEKDDYKTIPFKGNSYGVIPEDGETIGKVLATYTYTYEENIEDVKWYIAVKHTYAVEKTGISVFVEQKKWKENDEMNMQIEQVNIESPTLSLKYHYWYY